MTTSMTLIPGVDPEAVTSLPFGGLHLTTDQFAEVFAPYDGQLLGRVPVVSASDVDRAVAAARSALQRSPLPQWQRASILDRAAALLHDRREDFARCVALEAAKPITTARGEVDRAVSTLLFNAAVARTMAGEVVPLEASPGGEGKIGFVLRVPIGVIGAIAPFNFPLNLVAHKLGPAIAAGCPVVLKPASQTPFSSILLARLLIECGLPAEYLHVVTGSGRTVGNALVENDDVALITFTGSPEVGWAIRAKAPRKRVGLELGNNAPLIIDADGDWRTAVAKTKLAGFSHAGQSCISTQRILVHEFLLNDVVPALVKAVEELVVGDPLDEATQVSALISTAERDRVAQWISDAVDEGARIAVGGRVGPDGVLEPTVLLNVTPEMKVWRLEVFGPVVSVMSFTDLDEALRAVRTLDLGGVLINEGPAWSVREMTEERLVILNA